MAPMRAALASMALGLLLLLSGCGSGPKEPFKIVSGSENTVLEPIVSEFCRSRGVTCTFTYEGSLDIGLALGSAEGIDADAVWPASSVWIDLFDTGRKVKDTVSIAQMPVILGVRRSKAEALGWVGRPVTMADVLGAVKSGQLKFLMTSATQSNSGASAYLAMLTTALGGADRMMTADDLSRQDVRQTVGDLLGGVERSAGSSGWLADLYVKSAAEGTQYDAMWNYEALIKETNDKLRATGNEALYAIYPADGIAVADSPLGFVSRGKGDATEAFFKDLVTFLQSEPVAKRIAATGRRIPLGNVTAAAQADSNLDPSRLLTAIRLPEPTVIRQALDLYQSALRKPSLTALCLDYSGSMAGEGEEQLEAALDFVLTPDRAAQVLVQWTPDDQILVYPFESRVRERLVASGEPVAQQALLEEARRNSADGGTDMYGCAMRALEDIVATPGRETYLPAIVLMTDGRSEGDAEALIAVWRRVTPHVPIFGITFGDADVSQLDSVAEATSGRVFDGRNDLAGAFRAARGYN
jgi:Ca-activated chloride channel family protein